MTIFEYTSTRRFFLYSLLCLLSITLIVTVIFLFLTHQREEVHLNDELYRIQQNEIPLLVSSLWVTDYQSLQTVLNGLTLYRYITRAEVVAADDGSFFSGKKAVEGHRVITENLEYDFKGKVISIGTLHLFIDKRALHLDVLLLTGKLGLLQGVGSILVALLMTGIFHLLFGRHLGLLTIFLKENDPDESFVPYTLQRRGKRDDELQLLVDTLNAMGERISQYIDELKTQNNNLEYLVAERDQLFSIIAHDLKSPMAGLMSSTEMLANQPEIFSEKDIRFLSKELHKNARNTFALLEDLLQWSRMSQGGMDYDPTSSSLNELLNLGLATVHDVAKNKDVAIRRDIPHGLTVLADPPMLKTVIRNMLFNAIKFTRRDGEIVIKARQEGQTVTVAIQDNGIGMKEHVLATLFSLDKEKRQLGTEGEKGTGLGLVLCKQFIEQHGGEIWAESAPGKGTTVFFTLSGA